MVVVVGGTHAPWAQLKNDCKQDVKDDLSQRYDSDQIGNSFISVLTVHHSSDLPCEDMEN